MTSAKTTSQDLQASIQAAARGRHARSRRYLKRGFWVRLLRARARA
jgi:hypothetical protein